MIWSSEPTCKLEFFIILWSFPRVGPIFLGLELTTPSSNWQEASQTFAQYILEQKFWVSSPLWKSYRTPQSKCRPLSLPMSGSHCAWLLGQCLYPLSWYISRCISWSHGLWLLWEWCLGNNAKIFLENMSINGRKERSSTYGAS